MPITTDSSSRSGRTEAPDGQAPRPITCRPPVISAYRDAKEQFEHAYHSQALRITGGNISLVAKLAQKTRKEVYHALRRLDLAAGEYRESSSRMLAVAPVPPDDEPEPS